MTNEVAQAFTWTQAGATVLSGMVIVFAALIILIFMVWIMGKVLGTAAPKAPSAPPSPPKAVVTAPAAPAAPAFPAGPEIAVQEGIDEETVAVISAAVSCMMQEIAPRTAFAVTGIQRSNLARPTWRDAGLQQNTRSF